MARTKGATNKATKWREKTLAAQGEMPLSYMLKVLRSEESTADEKKWAAQTAAPYCHPRLTHIDAKVLAEINGRVENVAVIDVRNMDPDKRLQLRQLLLSAAVDEATDAEFEDVPEEEG